MISHPAYPVEPWCVRETALHLDILAQSESVFALANGHIGLRGNLDEGEPHGLPGSYLNGAYESRPLPFAEAGYGYPEAGETVINITNAKVIRLLVDDQPFDVRYGEVRAHERVLDFRAGLLERKAEWVSAGGWAVAMRSTRLVSFVQRSVAAICYEPAALDQALRVVLQSELVANEALPAADLRQRILRFDVTAETTTYRLAGGDAVGVFHHGQAVTVSADAPVVCETASSDARLALGPAPSQPAGREPLHRKARDEMRTREAT